MVAYVFLKLWFHRVIWNQLEAGNRLIPHNNFLQFLSETLETDASQEIKKNWDKTI